MKSLYEQLGGTYHQGEDGLFYPDLLPLADDDPHYGKYGRTRLTYLKEHHEDLYTGLLLSCKPNTHLNETDAAANAQMELITKQMAKDHGVSVELKARDQLVWVGGYGEYPQCYGGTCINRACKLLTNNMSGPPITGGPDVYVT